MRIDYDIVKFDNVILTGDGIVIGKPTSHIQLNVEFSNSSKRSFLLEEYNNDMKSLLQYIDYIDENIIDFTCGFKRELSFEDFMIKRAYEAQLERYNKMMGINQEDDEW